MTELRWYKESDGAPGTLQFRTWKVCDEDALCILPGQWTEWQTVEVHNAQNAVDAARYRYLRDPPLAAEIAVATRSRCYFGPGLDAAVDDAMKVYPVAP